MLTSYCFPSSSSKNRGKGKPWISPPRPFFLIVCQQRHFWGEVSLCCRFKWLSHRNAFFPLGGMSQLGRGGQSLSASELTLHTCCLPAPGQTSLQPPPSRSLPTLSKETDAGGCHTRYVTGFALLLLSPRNTTPSRQAAAQQRITRSASASSSPNLF